ncbi:class II fructose-bisphosphatase [Methylocystis parvus]|uniref:Fructose-1,6-bisphosphatase n=1 Tax=Methylocystis parvus TaxID=134 RepID=A0A6B8M7U7_9HYPH|nr:class II fructose-bisphosphatase [Methylocystis parvus]QGM98618.1 class II fructose-bisphosphatase [Methylocystis parvus]WBK01038.1 class II fructose-bisphosphatase [Methylocystis parvus OBBP]
MSQQKPLDAASIERLLTIELARATERAAIAAARLRGRGDEMAADRAAVEAMHEELARLPVRGRIVIGEGEESESARLHVGCEIGRAVGLDVELAVAPLEGATLCAKDQPGAIAIAAAASSGALLHAPESYMDKIAVGPGYPHGVVDLDRDPADNVRALAEAKGVSTSGVTVCVLDRPRHAEIISKCRKAGACVRLISDGDVAGVVFVTHPAETGVDMYLGRGGAPEGVLAAAVLRCAGGQMQGRLVLENAEQRARAAKHGPVDPRKKYGVTDMVTGDVVVCVTGVTDGPLVKGVVFGRSALETETLVYRSATGTVRRIGARRAAT